MKRVLLTAMTLFAAFTLPALALAQQEQGAVSGTGNVVIKRLPSAIRMQVQISGEGKTIQEALATLKERREAMRKKLADLGVSEDVIRFDDPNVGGQDQRAQMEMMMRSRMRPGAATPKPGPAMVRVVASAHAQWPVAAKSVEELLIAATQLEEKVKAAKLTEDKTATLEEQEALEEAIGLDMDGMGGNPNQPTFTFVAKVAPEERAKAMSEAFQKAKAAAAELAKAAGAELGPIKQLTGSAMGTSNYDDDFYYARMRGMQAVSSTDPDEIVGHVAGAVEINIYVNAAFLLK